MFGWTVITYFDKPGPVLARVSVKARDGLKIKSFHEVMRKKRFARTYRSQHD